MNEIIKDSANSNTATSIGTNCVIIMGLSAMLAPRLHLAVDDLVIVFCSLVGLHFAYTAWTVSVGTKLAKLWPAGKAFAFALWAFYAATRGAGATYNEHQMESAPTLSMVAGQPTITRAGFLQFKPTAQAPCSPMAQIGGPTGVQVLVWYNNTKVWAPAARGTIITNDACQVLCLVSGVEAWLPAVAKVGW